jgi:hypothetical protein
MRALSALIGASEIWVFVRSLGEKEGVDVCRAMASSTMGLVAYGRNPVQG